MCTPEVRRRVVGCATIALIAVVAVGCSVVDSAALDALQGGAQPSDVCSADGSTFIVSGAVGEDDITIDTRGLSDTIRDGCATSGTTPGNDAFFRFQPTGIGEYWHFHLKADDPGRDPIMYIIDAPASGRCNERACRIFQDACSDAARDEHFGFFPPRDGGYFIGIDDKQAGGGVYTLSVYRPICGMNGQEHGEPCDPGNPEDDTDDCDPSCRVELSAPEAAERPNNGTRGEANVLKVTAPGEITVSGEADTDCGYPDYFAIEVPAGGSVTVTAVDGAGATCTDGSGLAYGLELEEFDGDVFAGSTDAAGCPSVSRRGLSAGEYYIRVVGEAGEARAPYRIKVELTGA